MISIRRAGISKRVGRLNFKAAIGMYCSYKFRGLLYSASAVNAAQLCTVGIDQHSA